jgi:hypothetical protein
MDFGSAMEASVNCSWRNQTVAERTLVTVRLGSRPCAVPRPKRLVIRSVSDAVHPGAGGWTRGGGRTVNPQVTTRPRADVRYISYSTGQGTRIDVLDINVVRPYPRGSL